MSAKIQKSSTNRGWSTVIDSCPLKVNPEITHSQLSLLSIYNKNSYLVSVTHVLFFCETKPSPVRASKFKSCSLLRTVETIIASFSVPWNSSVVPTWILNILPVRRSFEISEQFYCNHFVTFFSKMCYLLVGLCMVL